MVKQARRDTDAESTSATETLVQAAALVGAGRLDEAEDLYARAIGDAEAPLAALKASGILAMRRGRLDLAAERFGRAHGIAPNDAAHANNLGLALRALGRMEEAERAFRDAIAAKPDHAKAHHNLGLILLADGRKADCERVLRRALEIDPAYTSASCHLARLLRAALRHDEASVVLREAIRHDPASDEALAEYGITLDLQRYLERSEKVWRRLITRRPDNAPWHRNLAHALTGQGRVSEAEASYRRALDLDPAAADVMASLGELCKMQGRLEEARSWIRQALQIVPDLMSAHSNLLVILNYEAEDGTVLLAEHRAWAQRHAAHVKRLPQREPLAHGGDRLRIGYLSPDFRQHSAAYFVEPLLEAHDRSAFEIHCYSGVTREDEFTARCRALADGWTNTTVLDDDALAARIAADGIDILVDLCGHFGGHRLLAMARHPAPVQATWMGYPATTGLGAIDYRIIDAITDPVDEGDRHHSERAWRLPGGFLCYRPYAAAPEVAPPPRLRRRQVTFGSFNNMAKVTPGVIACWSRLLERVPGARLLLKDRGLADPATRARVAALFAAQEIGEERLVLSGRIENLEGHLGLYGEVDIGLDPFPYNGTTTTCEALWMGVPVVTLRGGLHAGRVGASLLAQIGLDDLVADDEADLVARAAALAADGPRLDGLRRTLRQRMASSPLTDKADFARRMEAAYREMVERASGAVGSG